MVQHRKDKSFCSIYSSLKQINMVYLKAVLGGLLLSCSFSSASQPMFENVTNIAGISGSSQTFGVSWGDVNGDGWPDAFLTNHFKTPSLYLNQKDGSFLNVTDQHDVSMGGLDQHGAAWADYDNDGDEDLLIVSGGDQLGATALLRNEQGILKFQDSVLTGLDWSFSDRMPNWLDVNSDGLLDVIIANLGKKRPEQTSPLFLQTGINKFQLNHNFDTDGGFWVSQLIGPTSPAQSDLLFPVGDYFRNQNGVWSNETAVVFSPPIDTTTLIGNDYAYGDVNNDGDLDLYVSREGIRSQALQTGLNSFGVGYKSIVNELSGFDIVSAGDITINFSLAVAWEELRFGVGEEKIATPDDGFTSLTLAVSDPRFLGEPALLITGKRTWIWYSPSINTWHFRFASTQATRLIEFDLISQLPIQGSTLLNLPASDAGAKNYLFLSDGAGGFLPNSSNSGLSFVNKSHAAVLADFDNDMDLDMYMVNRNMVDNVDNQLFLNDGTGMFTEVPGAGDALGSEHGTGDSFAVSDYDRDGFLDLFVTNGRSDLRDSYNGPHELYRNLGNSNNWIQIDLVGVESNRNAIGAIVSLEVAGVTQTRYVDNGIHSISQNHRRIHFGLGDNYVVDALTVQWPSGHVQIVRDIPASQFVQVIEEIPVNLNGVPDRYVPKATDGVFAWQDVGTDQHHIVVSGSDLNSVHTYEVIVLSSKPFTSATGVDLEGRTDVLEQYPYGIRLTNKISKGIDGVDFNVADDARLMIAVWKDGEWALDALNVGSQSAAMAAVSWIVMNGDLPPYQRPDYGTQNQFVSGTLSNGNVLFEWSGDGSKHTGSLDLIASGPLGFIDPVGMDGNDTVVQTANSFTASGPFVGVGRDSVEVDLSVVNYMGVSYRHDDLLPGQNAVKGMPGRPNAGWLRK